MKIIYTILTGLILSFQPYLTYGSVQDPAKQQNALSADTSRVLINALSDYSVTVNGEQNSLQVTQNPVTGRGKGSLQKTATHKIVITGTRNSVKIDQITTSSVNIQQSGHGNRVNITQTNENTEKTKLD